MATIVEDWLGYLEQRGCRITLSVRAVVEVVATSTRVLRPPQLLAQVRARYPRTSLHTVNRTLARLLALGLIQRVHDAAGQPAFLAAGAERLPLVICERCGEAEYV
ncbi:MAG: transcriptional repressor, partial [Anaerolineales bacterium]|nr:transcriptional repressor [Anaerolineales bacterium]